MPHEKPGPQRLQVRRRQIVERVREITLLEWFLWSVLAATLYLLFTA